MNIRPPVGIYKHWWDGMQVHTPRFVLGEAGLDGMCMSYANLEIAKDMFYGAFADAPSPNVPCSREDGSMNMICADGTEVGTAPVWGVPFHMIYSIYLRDQDDQWIKKLYPYLKQYIEWWLENRTDDEGWLHSKCSWESGQDASRRFLLDDFDHGMRAAALAEFVRTVDIEAAVAEAIVILEKFAEISGANDDIDYWGKMASQRTDRVRAMFVDGWFRDFDARTGKPIIINDYYDIMMFLPVSLGIASKEQMDQIRPMFYHYRNNPIHFLEWPSFLFPFSEAAWNAGERMFIAEEIAKIGNRIYPRLDERDLQPVRLNWMKDTFPADYYYRIPGVSDEFWAIREDNPGGCENYGWGSTLPTLVIRNIIGFREDLDPNKDRFILAPALPDELFVTGKEYAITNLFFRGVKIDIVYKKDNEEKLTVALNFRSKKTFKYRVSDERGKTHGNSGKAAQKSTIKFSATNGSKYFVSILD